MYTREIDGKIRNFKFGIGFVRDIDKTKKVKGENGEEQKMGLTYAIAGLIDQDFEKLIDCLLYGNKYGGDTETLSRAQIEAWLDSDETTLERECTDLLDFFESANFTKKKTQELKEAMVKNEQLEKARFERALGNAKAGTT